MTGLEVRPFKRGDRERWDELVATSRNGTFVHGRIFLDTVTRAFSDRSIVIGSKGKIVGVMPAADHPTDSAMVDSHPATSYGGIVHDGALAGERMIAAMEAVADHCYHEGARVLRYKSIPSIYQRVPSQDDVYSLYRLGAVRTRCELASVIDVETPRSLSRHRARHLRKAGKAGLLINRDHQVLSEFWSVLERRLASKHDSAPQHTRSEISELVRRLPKQVECVVASEKGSVVAGAIVFVTGRVDHAQYLAADDRGYEVSALDLVIEDLVARGSERGARFVSLGSTTLHGGRQFNTGLHRYKSDFGAGSIVHETYDLAIG